jgi:ABC-type spermidine/putrescine transport system permease subunit II
VQLFLYISVFTNFGFRDNATSSGLRLLPMVIPMVIMSISSGIIVSKTGKYPLFLTIGTATLCLGMGMLYLLEVDSTFGQMVGLLIPIGFALGCIMQVSFFIFVLFNLVWI